MEWSSHFGRRGWLVYSNGLKLFTRHESPATQKFSRSRVLIAGIDRETSNYCIFLMNYFGNAMKGLLWLNLYFFDDNPSTKFTIDCDLWVNRPGQTFKHFIREIQFFDNLILRSCKCLLHHQDILWRVCHTAYSDSRVRHDPLFPHTWLETRPRFLVYQSV